MFTPRIEPGSLPIQLVHEEDAETWRQALPEPARAWALATAFRGEVHKVALLPDAAGRPAQVAVGLGRRNGASAGLSGTIVQLWQIAGLAERLPDGHFHLAATQPGGVPDALSLRHFAQGWAYGQYRYDRFRRKTPARQVVCHLPRGVDLAEVERVHAACSLARDLINTPASHLRPAVLADAVLEVGARYGAQSVRHEGESLQAEFPLVHAVGRASDSSPQLVELTWGNPAHPRIALIGKGVCFDSGGLDLKPAASMLLMKKDMGGAACTLALAQLVMDAGLAVHLHVVIPAVENAVGGNAFRPGDVLATRKGLSVEVGNTDAEGRLILADALALADAARPELLVDMATLTGAARVALGPELPALFTRDAALAAGLVRHGEAEADPLWQLPLWAGYDDELSSKVADLNNVAASGFAGAIIGGLFLQRFVAQATSWAHLDLYAWNPRERPGRPVGAEAQCVRALYAWLKERYPQ